MHGKEKHVRVPLTRVLALMCEEYSRVVLIQGFYGKPTEPEQSDNTGKPWLNNYFKVAICFQLRLRSVVFYHFPGLRALLHFEVPAARRVNSKCIILYRKRDRTISPVFVLISVHCRPCHNPICIPGSTHFRAFWMGKNIK